MALSTTANRRDYVGDGATVAFSLPYLCYDSTHVKVYKDAVLQSSGYTVTGVGASGGVTVTFAVAPTTGVAILLLRTVPETQLSVYSVAGAFPAKTTEKNFDLVVMQIQQMQELIDRLPTAVNLLAGSVVFGGAAGAIAQDNTNFFWDDTNNQLKLAAVGSGAGIKIGGDTQLYRSAADVLRTPDSFTTDATLTAVDAILSGNARVRSNTGVLSFGASDDVVLERTAADVLSMRRGANGQAFSAYFAYTDAANNQRMIFGRDYQTSSQMGVWSKGIGTFANSTGFAIGSMDNVPLAFYTSGVNVWAIGTTGDLVLATNDIHLIGDTNHIARVIYTRELSLHSNNALIRMGAADDISIERIAADSLRLPTSITIGSGTENFDRVAANIVGFGAGTPTGDKKFRVYNALGNNTEYSTVELRYSENGGVGTPGNDYAFVIEDGAGSFKFFVGGAYIFSVGNVVGDVTKGYWNVRPGGADDAGFGPQDDNQRDIGHASYRIRTGYFGTSVVTPLVDSAGATLALSPGAGDIRWNKALVALGGGAAPTFGTIGGAGPTVAGQNTWMRVLDSTGAAFWVPAWK